jgi:hypothetical protein
MIYHLLAIIQINGANKDLLIVLHKDIANMIVSRDKAVKK